MKEEKAHYLAPKISSCIVELEKGIVNSSASVSGGNQYTPNTPQIDEWKTGEDGGEGYTTGDI